MSGRSLSRASIRTMQDAVAVYHDLGLSCYPTVFMEKRCMPGIGWKVYQQRVPTAEELGIWHYNYSQDYGGPGYGIAIPTGYGAGSIVPYALDCDNGIPTSIERCHTTTIEHGGRGPCFVFNGPPGVGPAKLVVTIDGTEVELKGLGGSFTAPASVYKDGTPYHYPPGLGWNQIKDLPPILTHSLEEYAIKPQLPRILNAHGYDQLCLAMIMDPHRTIQEGECYESFWAAYWLLQRKGQNGKGSNTKEYAQRVIRARNALLRRPLPESRLRDIFNGKSLKYAPGCNAARSRLPWIISEKLCWRCQRMETHSALNVRKAQEAGLGPTEQAVIHYITLTGVTSLSGIGGAINVKDYRTVKSAMTRIIAEGCWPDNVDPPARNAGDFDGANPSNCDFTSTTPDE
ncbi:MAG: hypothetical protein AB9886_01495 [Candidatus Cryosericum sp.]